jgi:hypothetical protein
MENNPNKSKAIIITIVAILVLLLSMYLLFKNRDAFGVKTSATIAKIFSPLAPSDNTKDLTPIGSNNSLLDSFSNFFGNLFGDSKKTTPPPGWVFDSSSNTWTLPDGSTFNTNTGIWSLSDGSTFDINTGLWVMPDSSTFNSNTKVWDMADGSTFDNNTGIWVFPDGSTFNVNTGIWTLPDGSTFNSKTGEFIPSIGAVFNSATGIWTLSDGSTFDTSTGIWTSSIGTTLQTKTGIWTSTSGDSWFDSNTLTWHFAGGSTFNSGTGIWTAPDQKSWFDSNTLTWHFDNGTIFDIKKWEWVTTDGQCTNGATNYPACTSFTSKCTNGANNYPDCTSIVNPLDNNSFLFPQVTVTADKTSLAKNEKTTIRWESTNTTSCNAGAGNGTGTSGSFSTGALTTSKSFSVSCTGANGTGSKSVFVMIGTGPFTFPQVVVTADKTSIAKGESTMINWTSVNTTSCSAGEGNGTGTSGSFSTGALTTSKMFTVTCTGASGTGSGMVFVGVGTGSFLFPQVKVTADKTSIAKGESTTIRWTVDPLTATSCNAGAGNGTGTSGSFSTGALTTSKSFSVSCTGASGTGSGMVFVGVGIGPFIFPQVTLTADPSTVSSGEPSTIGWTSVNTTSCSAGEGNGTGTSGSFSTGALTTSKMFTVTCTGANGTGSKSVFVVVGTTIDILPPPIPLPDLVVGMITPKMEITLPIVSTLSISDITKNSAIGTGAIISNGGSTITSRGIVWSTTSMPTTSVFTKSTSGVFYNPSQVWKNDIKNLSSNTTYHIRAYATNSLGTSYGADLTFITTNSITPSDSVNVIPIVTSPASASVTSSSASLGANITSLGMPANIFAHGICYNTTGSPTLSNAHCTASTSPQTTGSYTVNISGGIPSGTTYRFVGYATNATGTGYSPEGTFTTLGIINSGNLPTVTSPTAGIAGTTSALLGATVTSTGGSPITARGTCWGVNTNPTTKCSVVAGTTGTFTGTSVGVMPSNTLIYYRGYATNSYGTAYSANGTFTTKAVSTCTPYTIPLTSCFVADTLVELANGTSKNIQDVKVGDILKGEKTNNKVLGLHRPELNGKLYSFNGGRYFVTEEHPFKTTDGWKSINPEKTQLENIGITVTTLRVGDTLITDKGNVLLKTISSKDGKDNTELFNFILDGDHTYYADGYLVHNKTSCDATHACGNGYSCSNGLCSICPGTCPSGYTASCSSGATLCSCNSGGGGGGLDVAGGTCVYSVDGIDPAFCAKKKTPAICEASLECSWVYDGLQ